MKLKPLHRERHGYPVFIPMEDRYPRIIEVLKSAITPMTAREISAAYIDNPNSSDPLVTGMILNVLKCAGFVTKHTSYRGKSPRYSYSLAEFSDVQE